MNKEIKDHINALLAFLVVFCLALILGYWLQSSEKKVVKIIEEQKRCEELGGSFWVGMDYVRREEKVLMTCHSKSVDLFAKYEPL